MGRRVIPNKQPKAPARAAIGNVPASFLWLPSASNEDLARRSPLTTTGTVSREIVGSIPSIAGEFVGVTNNSNRLSWAKKVDPNVFTVVFHGYLVSPSTSEASFPFGQFEPNSVSTASISQWCWGIYEGGPTNSINFFVSDVSTSTSVASGTFVANTPVKIAASFNRGILKISVNGGAVVSATASFSAMKTTWSMQSGGYWGSAAAVYNPGNRTLLAATFDGYAADNGSLQRLSENPYLIFRKRDRRTLYIANGGAAAELAGSSTSTATGTASLTTQIQLTGAAASVATAAGSLTSVISLSGAAASVSVASGVLTTQIRLSGDALAQVLATGALTTQISLSGAAVMQALASAGLTTTPAGLSGSAVATATATGQLSTGILLLCEASCIAIAAGGLTTAIQMTGAAVSVSTATGDLTVTSGFSASALAEVTATGTLSTQIQLDAAAVMQAIAAASLTTGEQTVAFYDELDAFYGDFAVQCSANGTPFNGILDTTDADQFGTLSMSTHRLRYPEIGSAVTAQGEVMVSGVRYKVIEIPRRISRSEMVAELVKQP